MLCHSARQPARARVLRRGRLRALSWQANPASTAWLQCRKSVEVTRSLFHERPLFGAKLPSPEHSQTEGMGRKRAFIAPIQVAWRQLRAHHHGRRENQIPIALAAQPAPNFSRLMTRGASHSGGRRPKSAKARTPARAIPTYAFGRRPFIGSLPGALRPRFTPRGP